MFSIWSTTERVKYSSEKEQFGVKEGYLLLDQTCQKVLLESPTLEEKPQQILKIVAITAQAVFRFITPCLLVDM